MATKHITDQDSQRMAIMAAAGWTPQEIANRFPDYHADQIRNHLNKKHSELKGKIKKDSSRGNTKMYALLKEMFPKYKIEQEFPIGKKLRLDCYIGDPLNLGFEYDGIQHSKSVDHFGGDEALIKNLENDSTKEDICKGRGISLIRINHDEDLTIELLQAKIDASGYGTGLIQEQFRTAKEKQKEKKERLSTHAKRIAKNNYEKAKQKVKNSPRYQAQKEQARANRKAAYQRSKAWAASRNNKS